MKYYFFLCIDDVVVYAKVKSKIIIVKFKNPLSSLMFHLIYIILHKQKLIV